MVSILLQAESYSEHNFDMFCIRYNFSFMVYSSKKGPCFLCPPSETCVYTPPHRNHFCFKLHTQMEKFDLIASTERIVPTAVLTRSAKIYPDFLIWCNEKHGPQSVMKQSLAKEKENAVFDRKAVCEFDIIFDYLPTTTILLQMSDMDKVSWNSDIVTSCEMNLKQFKSAIVLTLDWSKFPLITAKETKKSIQS